MYAPAVVGQLCNVTLHVAPQNKNVCSSSHFTSRTVMRLQRYNGNQGRINMKDVQNTVAHIVFFVLFLE